MTRHTVTITNPERTFIVADIHGQDALLEKALGEVGFSAANGDVLYGGFILDDEAKEALQCEVELAEEARSQL